MTTQIGRATLSQNISAEVELVVVTLFGLLMPVLGYGLYRYEEDRARRSGSLSEY